MPFSTAAKNKMLDAIARGTSPSTYAQYAGLLSRGANITVTATASTGTFTSSAAHGLSVGDVVVLSGLTGGSGFVAGRIYYVATAPSGTTFTLALTSGGSAVTGGSDISAGTANKLSELSGGSPAYARIASAFAASGGGANSDSSTHSFNVPAATTVSYVGYWTTATAGTGELEAITTVTDETFGGQGTYNLTSEAWDLNAAA